MRRYPSRSQGIADRDARRATRPPSPPLMSGMFEVAPLPPPIRTLKIGGECLCGVGRRGMPCNCHGSRRPRRPARICAVGRDPAWRCSRGPGRRFLRVRPMGRPHCAVRQSSLPALGGHRLHWGASASSSPSASQYLGSGSMPNAPRRRRSHISDSRRLRVAIRSCGPDVSSATRYETEDGRSRCAAVRRWVASPVVAG
jgi:hypothetical protein